MHKQNVKNNCQSRNRKEIPMKKNYGKQLTILALLIALSCAALAFSENDPTASSPAIVPPAPVKSGILTLSGNLVQDKIFTGGDGRVSLSLSIQADEIKGQETENTRYADMVIVLDRSGSMEGQKLRDAKQAVLKLLGELSPRDRFALVSYSGDVRQDSGLLPVTAANREHLTSVITGIRSGGGTNLGGGLQQGISLLTSGKRNGNLGRLILISDGLANEGITDQNSLGNMASAALEKEFAISAVGVGNDFNEELMTAIADRGTGNYYYLETPENFANVFLNEFRSTRRAAATAVEIRIPLEKGVILTDAAGYPVQVKNNTAIFYPGDLLSGQSRKIFLTFRVPVHEENTFDIRNISLAYLHRGESHNLTLTEAFRIACVKDQKAALSSIRKDTWEKKVIHDEYNQLKQDVAAEIKKGNQNAAMTRIEEYRKRQSLLNEVVQSPTVQENLDRDVAGLQDTVQETFAGEKEEVFRKQKSNAKALQFEGYQGRRKSGD